MSTTTDHVEYQQRQQRQLQREESFFTGRTPLLEKMKSLVTPCGGGGEQQQQQQHVVGEEDEKQQEGPERGANAAGDSSNSNNTNNNIDGDGGGVSFWLWKSCRGGGKTSLLKKFMNNLVVVTPDEDSSTTTTTATTVACCCYSSFHDPKFIQGPQSEDCLSPIVQSIDNLLISVDSDSLFDEGSQHNILSPYDVSILRPFLPRLQQKLQEYHQQQQQQQQQPSYLGSIGRIDSINTQQLATALSRLLGCISQQRRQQPGENNNDGGGGGGDDINYKRKTAVWCIDDLHLASPAALSLLERILSKLSSAAVASSSSSSSTSSKKKDGQQQQQQQQHQQSHHRTWVIFATCNELDTNASTSETPLGPFLVKCKNSINELKIRDVPPLSSKNVSRILAHNLMGTTMITRTHSPSEKIVAIHNKLKPLSKLILEQTKGNALAVIWYIRLLQDLRMLPKQAIVKNEKESDSISIDWDMNAIENLPIMGDKAPKSTTAGPGDELLLNKLISLRWRAMPPVIQSVIQVAACFHGPVFGIESMYGLLSSSSNNNNKNNNNKHTTSSRKCSNILPTCEKPDKVYEWLAYATQLGFLNETRVGLFGFAHDAIQDVIYTDSPSSKLHLELGRRCSNRSNYDSEDDDGTLTPKDIIQMYGTVQHWARAPTLLAPEDKLEASRLGQRIAKHFLSQQCWFAASNAARQSMVGLGYRFEEFYMQVEDVWKIHYSQLLECSTTFVRAEYACGRLDSCRITGKDIIKQCHTTATKNQPSSEGNGATLWSAPAQRAAGAASSAKLEVYQTQISSLLQQHRTQDALGLVMVVLRELGEDNLPKIVSKTTTPSGVCAYLLDRIIPETLALLINFNFEDIDVSQRRRRGSGRRGVGSILDLTKESNIGDRIEFWERIVDISQLHGPIYQALALLRVLQLTVEYGRSFPLSGLAFVFYGFLLAKIKGLYTESRHYANMGIALITNTTEGSVDRDPVYAARTKIMFNEIPFFSSQLITFSDLELANDTLCSHGYLEAACMGKITTFWTNFGSEAILDASRVDGMRRFLQVLRDYGHEHLVLLYSPLVRLVERLTDTQHIAQDNVNEEENRRLERLVQKAQRDPSSVSPTSFTPALNIAICRMVGAFLFDNLTEAEEMLDLSFAFDSQSQQHPNRRFSTCSMLPVQNFLQGMVVWSLADVAQSQSNEDSIAQTMKRYKQGEVIARKLDELIQRGGPALSPGYRHMLLLLRAQDQCSRPSSVALSSIANAFDSAIAAASSGAHRNKSHIKIEAVPFFSALGCERAALFFKTNGEIKTAATYYKRAMMGYQKWGAYAKAKDIERKYQAIMWLLDHGDEE